MDNISVGSKVNFDEISTSKYVIKKSKFFAHLIEVNSLDEVEPIIKYFKQKYKKLNHVCAGIYFKSETDELQKFVNDREVGQPGKILLHLLGENNLQSHILIIARDFGGIKLGQGGVARAFKEAALICLRDL